MTIEEANKVVLIDSSGNYIVPVIDPLDALPAQDDKAGKFLKTDGEQASWEDIPPATMLNIKKDLMKANGKKVQFVCSEQAPVTIDFLDGTQKTFTYLPEYDMSNLGNGTYPIATNKASMTFASGRIGNLPIDTNGNASGFAQGRYIYWGTAGGSFSQAVQGKTWEVKAKFTTGNDVTSAQGIIGGDSGTYLLDMPSIGTDSHFHLNLSSNGTSYDIANASGTYTVLPNTTYWTRTRFTGTQYIFEYSLDGTNYITDITVNSSTSIENTPDNLTLGARAGVYFKGSIDLKNTKAYANDTLIMDANWFATDSEYLGFVTLTADGITNITNNYQTETINPFEEVIVHTKESYAKSTEDAPTNLDLIPFTFVDIDYSSYATVSANTAYTLTKDVMVNTNSISTFTITKDGANYTVYGTWLPVRAGTTFKSSVAGKYYSFEGY